MKLSEKSTYSGDLQVTAIGLFATFFVAISYFGVARSLVNKHAVFYNLILGLSLQLAVWLANLRFRQAGYSLLAVYGGFVLLSFLPAGNYLLIFFGVMSLLFFGVSYRPRKLAMDPYLATTILGLLYSVVVFLSFSRNIGDPLIDEKVRQFALNPDTLFHAALAEMIRDYGTVSTGLDGLVRDHYHILSHFTYARASKLLGITVYESYGYTNFIVFAPLLITQYLRLLDEAIHPFKYKTYLMHLLMLGGPLSECLGWQSNNHFVSESYLIGLLLFGGGLSVILSLIRSPKWSTGLIVALLIYLPLTTIAKVSVGAILCAASIIAVFTTKSRSLAQKAALSFAFGIFWLPGFLFAKNAAIPGLEMKFYWNFYKDRAIHEPYFIHYLFKCFPYFFLLLPAYWLLKSRKLLDRELTTWSLILVAATLIGFAGLNITIDSSGYYFSNVHAFVALAVFGVFIGNVVWNKRDPVLIFYAKGLCGFFALCILFFFSEKLHEELRTIHHMQTDLTKGSTYQNPYTNLFHRVRNDPDSKLMVYIPKTETGFWDHEGADYFPWRDQECNCMPFYIPILSGKPAVFGLPDPAKNCYTFHRGYESYSKEEYRGSAQRNHTDEELCQTVRSKGFHGFYRISHGVAQKHLCST